MEQLLHGYQRLLVTVLLPPGPRAPGRSGVLLSEVLVSSHSTCQHLAMRVLIVEDQTSLAKQITSALIEAGHDPVVVHDGERAISEAEAQNLDLILLDVGLPRIDGFTVLKEIREHGCKARIRMLTARGEVSDIVKGLQLGADDYLGKPFAMQELLARIRALGRRYAEEPEITLKASDLTLSLADRKVQRGSRPIELSSRELTLLKVLMREPGRIFTRTELCERVWERKHEYDAKLVEVFIGRLRKKLGQPPLIHTVKHVGYTISGQ